jgi:hypothetical protein
MAASGMWLQSRSSAFSGQAPRETSSQLGPLVDLRAHLLRGFDEADVALDRGGAHAFDAHAGVARDWAAMAPSAMK